MTITERGSLSSLEISEIPVFEHLLMICYVPVILPNEMEKADDMYHEKLAFNKLAIKLDVENLLCMKLKTN